MNDIDDESDVGSFYKKIIQDRCLIKFILIDIRMFKTKVEIFSYTKK